MKHLIVIGFLILGIDLYSQYYQVNIFYCENQETPFIHFNDEGQLKTLNCADSSGSVTMAGFNIDTILYQSASIDFSKLLAEEILKSTLLINKEFTVESIAESKDQYIVTLSVNNVTGELILVLN